MNKEHDFTDLSPEEYKAKAKNLMGWHIMIFFSAVFIVLIVALRDNANSLYSYIGALSISIAGMVYLYKTKKADPLFLGCAIAGSAICHYTIICVPQISHYADFVWITILSTAAFLGSSRRLAVALLVANVAGIGYYIFFKHHNHIGQIVPLEELELTGAYLELILSFFVLGYLMYQFMKFQTVWEKAYANANKNLSEQNEIIEKKNQENITLLKEIHHRVKNNLQIIVSLLRLQKSELKQDESKAQFQEAINRVLVMASIHQKLYQLENLNSLNLDLYIKELINELKLIFQNSKDIRIKVNCTYTGIDLKTIIPVGLLINELISNSLKYAFIDRNEGEISLSITETSDGFEIIYTDNGTWKENKKETGFGLELIDIFTEQMNGSKTLITDQTGSKYIFQLKTIN